MRIIYYSSHPHISQHHPSGYGTHMREIIREFRLAGHEVFTLISGDGPLPASENESVVPQHTQAKKGIKKFIPAMVWESVKDLMLLQHDKKMGRRLEELIREVKPDLVYERCYYMMTSGVNVCYRNKVKHFLEMNAPYPEERVYFSGASLLRPLAEKAESAQVRKSNRVFVVSSALKTYLLEKHKANPEKIVVTPNAVRMQDIATDEHLMAEIKKRLGNSPLVIGFVGSVFPYHGVDKLIESFVEVSTYQGLSDARLIIVGDGALLAELKKRVTDSGIADKVWFTGNIRHSEVFSYISCMDITVMAKSNWYGSPVKIFEYGAMQKAIIAPGTVPVKDVMIDKTDGILVGDNSEELTRALIFLGVNENERRRMAASFYQKVIQHHTWEKVAAIILKHYA